MKTSIQLDFENNAHIVINWLLKLKYRDWLIHWIVKNLKNYHEILAQIIYSDSVMMKHEKINFDVIFFF
jgi:hypothetical protein